MISIVVFVSRRTIFFFLPFQTRESYNFIFNFSPFGQRSFLPFLSRELFESPAYDNRLWKKLGPSGPELSSCSLLSIEEETSFEQELPFFFPFLSFFFQLCAEVWNDALWKSRIWLNDIPTKKRNGKGGGGGGRRKVAAVFLRWLKFSVPFIGGTVSKITLKLRF